MPVGVVPFPFGACRICSDSATGTHYGVATCEGCKGFFKRSVARGDQYKCFFGDRCSISPQTRNRCKACRFRRCREQGMSLDAVKMGRIPKVEKERALMLMRRKLASHSSSNVESLMDTSGDSMPSSIKHEDAQNPTYSTSSLSGTPDMDDALSASYPYQTMGYNDEDFNNNPPFSPDTPLSPCAHETQTAEPVHAHQEWPSDQSEGRVFRDMDSNQLRTIVSSFATYRQGGQGSRSDDLVTSDSVPVGVEPWLQSWLAPGRLLESAACTLSGQGGQHSGGASFGTMPFLAQDRAKCPRLVTQNECCVGSSIKDGISATGSRGMFKVMKPCGHGPLSGSRQKKLSTASVSFHGSSMDRLSHVVPKSHRRGIACTLTELSPPAHRDTPSASRSTPSVSHSTLLASRSTLSASHGALSASHRALSASHSTSSASHRAPSANHSIPSVSHSSPSICHSIPSTNHSIPSASQSTPSASHSIHSTSHSTPSASHSIPSASYTSPSANHSTLLTSHNSSSASHNSSSASHSTPSASHSTLSASLSTLSASLSTPSASHSTPSASHSTPSANHSTPSASHSTPSASHSSLTTSCYLATTSHSSSGQVVSWTSADTARQLAGSAPQLNTLVQGAEYRGYATKDLLSSGRCVERNRACAPSDVRFLDVSADIARTCQSLKNCLEEHAEFLKQKPKLPVLSDVTLETFLNSGETSENYAFTNGLSSSCPASEAKMKLCILHKRPDLTRSSEKVQWPNFSNKLTLKVSSDSEGKQENAHGEQFRLESCSYIDSSLGGKGQGFVNYACEDDGSEQASFEGKPEAVHFPGNAQPSSSNNRVVLMAAFHKHFANLLQKKQRLQEFLRENPEDAHLLETPELLTREELTETWECLNIGLNEKTTQILGFCKEVPGFATLDPRDQSFLLKRAFYDIWMILSSPFLLDKKSYLTFSNGKFYRKWLMEKIVSKTMVERLFRFAEQFNDLGLNDMEVAMLCAVQLTAISHDMGDMVNLEAVQQVNSTYLDQLVEEVSISHPHTCSRILVDIFRLIPLLMDINKLQVQVASHYLLMDPGQGMLPGHWLGGE